MLKIRLKILQENFQRKEKKHKESALKKRKIKNKKWFSKVCNDKYKELNRISKSLNSNPYNHFLRTKFYQLRKVYKSLYRKPKRRYDQKVIIGFGAL